jgi:hypothetical protein
VSIPTESFERSRVLFLEESFMTKDFQFHKAIIFVYRKREKGHIKNLEHNKFSYAALLKQTYSIEIASSGHSSTQAPQSIHSLETLALSLTIEIASTGHALTQLSQPVHFSASTRAAILISPCYIKHYTLSQFLKGI